ncbi:SPASM domain-containing protein, partial [Desulfobulbus sp. US1]|nr:SPASM domain-containing protein [Desulfobulbus sp. US1]
HARSVQICFFVDPAGNLLPCNGSAHPMIMGNLHAQSFEAIWHSPQAEAVRQQVRQCDRQCWMIGSAAPAMKKQIIDPLHWIIKNKLLLLRSSSCKNIKLLPI